MPVPLPSHAKLVYKGRSLQAYEYSQKLYDGSIATFETIVRPDSASVIAFLDHQTVLLLQEERPNRTEPFWALPGGCVDANESLEEAAMREFQEETGYKAGVLELWHKKIWNGRVQYEESLFIAKHISPSSQGRYLDAGEHITLIPTSWKKLVELSLRDEIRGPTLANCILAMEFDPKTKERLRAFLQT